MAEILFRAVDNTHPDGNLDKAASYKKGYPVDALPDGQSGTEIIPPDWITVHCPELSVEQVRPYLESWERRITYSIMAHNVPLDGYRVKIFNDSKSFGASDIGKLSRSDAESFLAEWSATVFSVADNEVVFDVGIHNAITSAGFIRRDRTGLVFSEVTYNEATGEHRIEIDFSATAHTVDAIENALKDRGASFIITNIQTKKTEATFGRDDVFSAFKEDVEHKTNRVECRRRYHLSEADVDTVLGMGGEITLTKAQLISKLLNKSDG